MYFSLKGQDASTETNWLWSEIKSGLPVPPGKGEKHQGTDPYLENYFSYLHFILNLGFLPYMSPIFEISKLSFFTLEYLLFCTSDKENVGHLFEIHPHMKTLTSMFSAQ